MKTILHSTVLAVLSMLFVLPTAARAEQPGQHPAYLHALGDLKMARFELQRATATARCAGTRVQPSAESTPASTRSGGPRSTTGRNPTITSWTTLAASSAGPASTRRSDSFAKRVRVLSEKESNLFAHGLRDRAVDHLDKAIRFTEKASPSQSTGNHRILWRARLPPLWEAGPAVLDSVSVPGCIEGCVPIGNGSPDGATSPIRFAPSRSRTARPRRS